MAALLIGLLLAADQVGIHGRNELGLLVDLPEEEESSAVRQAEVTCDEALDAEGLEGVETDEQKGAAAEEQAEPRRIGVEGSNVVECVVGKALGETSPVPANEDQDHHGVGSDEAGGGQINEPEEDLNGRVGRDEESDAADETDDANAVDGDTRLGALEENLGRLSICTRVLV